MLVYRFKPNARHSLVSLFIGRDMNGEGSIVSLFNANVKVNEHKRLQSIRIIERDRNLEDVSGAIYDAIDDIWCYPKWADPKGIKVPPRAFMLLSHNIAQAIQIGFIGIEGDNMNGLKAIATGAREQLTNVTRGESRLITFADPPEILSK